MLGASGACSPEKNDKNGATWCILSVPKYVINQQQPELFAIYFSKINPDAHVSIKINTFTFYKAGGLGAIAPPPPHPRSQRNLKKSNVKMEAYLVLFFPSNYLLERELHTRRIGSSVMMWIHTRAMGVGGMLPWKQLIKWCDLAHSERSEVCYYQHRNQQF